MNNDIFSKLFIFEMANNHMGDVEHGLRIIQEIHEITKNYNFKFAFKFQYRHLDTFIHPSYRERRDIKYVKRFLETRLGENDFLRMKNELTKLGFISVCTPFDEPSVSLIQQHQYDIIKIASCSFTDWPLLEGIVATDKPLIASTAGASLEDIDKVTTFLEHRNKQFCLMHCVGSYPTSADQLELNQIDFFRSRYTPIPIGFSTHEEPSDTAPIKIAIAKGAAVFERHVGLATESYQLNAYSSSPSQIKDWLESASKAYEMCGVAGRRRAISRKEETDLKGLQRGVFAAANIDKGTKIEEGNIFHAIPCCESQLLANDMSKYMNFVLKQTIRAGEPIMTGQVTVTNIRQQVLDIIKAVCGLIKQSGIKLQDKLELELSHHYGIDKFQTCGCAIINCVNREYCKKIILLLPGQTNPTHSHKLKEETFHVLYGDLNLTLDGVERTYSAGDLIVVERNKKHSFSSNNGSVLEEISTTHHRADSYYDDENIAETAQRKTYMTFYADWLTKDIV